MKHRTPTPYSSHHSPCHSSGRLTSPLSTLTHPVSPPNDRYPQIAAGRCHTSRVSRCTVQSAAIGPVNLHTSRELSRVGDLPGVGGSTSPGSQLAGHGESRSGDLYSTGNACQETKLGPPQVGPSLGSEPQMGNDCKRNPASVDLDNPFDMCPNNDAFLSNEYITLQIFEKVCPTCRRYVSPQTWDHVNRSLCGSRTNDCRLFITDLKKARRNAGLSTSTAPSISHEIIRECSVIPRLPCSTGQHMTWKLSRPARRKCHSPG